MRASLPLLRGSRHTPSSQHSLNAAAAANFSRLAQLLRASPESVQAEHLGRPLATLASKVYAAGRTDSRGIDAALTEREISLPSPRFTPGVMVDVNYLWGTGADRWEQHFRTAYRERGLPTAPLSQCPLCFSKHSSNASHTHKERSKKEEKVKDGCSATLSSPLRAVPDASQLTFSSSSSPSNGDHSTWYNPYDLMNHLSYTHPHEGFMPSELTAFNHATAVQLSWRCLPREVRRRRRRQAASAVAVELPRNPVQQGSHSATSDDDADFIERLDAAPPFRLIILFDTANIEFSGADMVLQLLKLREAVQVFSSASIAVACMTELFIPPTAKVVHGAFQLAQLGQHSDCFNFYAVNRLESGDLASASLAAELRTLAGRYCAPIILFTLDMQQRACMTELYGDWMPTLLRERSATFSRKNTAGGVARLVRSALSGTCGT